MTHAQARLLAFIADFQTKFGGVTPSYRVMAGAMGLGGIGQFGGQLEHLKSEGRISINPKTRGITITGSLSHVSDSELLAELQRRNAVRRDAA